MAETSAAATPNHTVLRVFQSKAETRACYNKISRFYDLLAEHSEAPMRHAGLDKLNAQPGEKILEIGFGTRQCITTLAHEVGRTGKVYGIDLSDEMLELAQENMHRAGQTERVELTVGDGVKLPYPSDSMDGIFMSFTLELFDTPEIPLVLAECKRVLRPGGRIAVVRLSKVEEARIVLEIYEWSHRHFPNLIDCRPIFVQESLQQAGFRIASAERKSMWVPVEIVLGVKDAGK